MVPLQLKGLECKVVVTVKHYPNSTETEINHNKTMLLNAYPNHYNFQTACIKQLSGLRRLSVVFGALSKKQCKWP